MKVILTNRLTIGSSFRVKEHLPVHLCSNVIYQYKCASEGCTYSYVGSTERILHDRTCEHIGVSFCIGSRLTDPKPSSIREHSRLCLHSMQQDSFKIVGKCGKGDDLRLLESVFIQYLKPDLNNTETSAPLHII